MKKTNNKTLRIIHFYNLICSKLSPLWRKNKNERESKVKARAIQNDHTINNEDR